MEWIDIKSRCPNGRDPRNVGVCLLKGTVDHSTLDADQRSSFLKGVIRVVGYYDFIDEAWALTSTPWYGPFFNPTHYAIFPSSLDLG